MTSHKGMGVIGAGLFWAMVAMPALAQNGEPAPSDTEVHDQLRALRDQAVTAFKERDIDALLECLTDDVTVVIQNGELYHGHDGVREFHQKMSEGDDRKVQSQTTDFKTDELSLLYGEDTATAHGTIEDHFALSGGMEFDLFSRWTATLVKEGDQWKVAVFHVSTDMFDNGVMDQLMWWNSLKVGMIALLAGIVVALVMTKVFGKKPAAGEHA
jgi:uncharacterized protein (TIGR02246 family)